MRNKLWFVMASLVVSVSVHAMTPPSKAQLEQYKKDGTLQQRIETAKALNNHRFNPSLVKQFAQRNLAALKGGEQSQANNKQDATPLDGYFPSVGAPKMLVLLVEFPDYQHADVNSRDYVSSRIFGTGDVNEFPYDSQREFYLRSSYKKLDIQGNVLDWFQTDYDRPVDDGNNHSEVTQQIIKDAINYHDAQGHDFSQYDNDGDGDIDYVAVIWTGPTGAWASLWWGSFFGFSDDAFTVDGKTISTISWQQVSYSEDEGPFSPTTLIHETGHALGLPDFYDYDGDVGPKGGLGGMDQMAGGHDHNSFTKYILGWLTPEVANGSIQDLTLLPLSKNASSVLLKKDATDSTKWDEFFIAEYRNKYGNDQGLPNEGLVVWHIDATLNQWGYFENNNSFTDHKLIRLVQADGLEQIESRSAAADAGDFFTTGQEFSPNTKPQTRFNDGGHSGVSLKDIKVSTEKIDLTTEIHDSVPNFAIVGIEDLGLVRAGQTLTVSSNEDDIEKVEIYSGDKLLKSVTEAPYNLTFDNELITTGEHEIKVVMTNQQGGKSTEFSQILYFDGKPSNLVVNLTEQKDQELTEVFSNSEFSVVESSNLIPLSSVDFPLVHLSFGSSYTPWVEAEDGTKTTNFIFRAAEAAQVESIKSYLADGGKLIIEGESVLYQTPLLREVLGINTTDTEVRIETVTGTNLHNDASIDLTVTEERAPVSVDLIENADDNQANVLLTAKGQKYDFDTNQWLRTEGTCSLAKELAEFNTKVVISSCLSSYLNKSEKANVYNTYLEYLDVKAKLVGNRLPQVNAGEDREVEEGVEVTLLANAIDPDNDELTITWSQTIGQSVTLSDINSLTPSFTAPEVGFREVVEFELKVEDGEATVTDLVAIIVNNVNKPPVVSAGDDVSFDEGNIVKLNATATDADGDDLTITWKQLAGDQVTLTDAETLTPSFTAPEVKATQMFEFELTVTDGSARATDVVVVSINHVNKLPVVSAGTSQSVVEGASVSLSASATDADEDALTISWVQTSGPQVSLSNSTTLTPSFTAPEVTSSQVLAFEVTVSDGQESVKDSVSVTVQNSATTPATNNASSEQSSGGSTGGMLVALLSMFVGLRRLIAKQLS